MMARAAQGLDDGTAWVPSAGRPSADGDGRRAPARAGATDPSRTVPARGAVRLPLSPATGPALGHDEHDEHEQRGVADLRHEPPRAHHPELRAGPDGDTARDGWAAGPAGESEGARLVRAQVEAAQERARRAADLSAEVDALRTTVRAPRGEVTVEVDAGGRVTRVAFSERARTVAPSVLGRLVEETIRAAARECGARAVALVEGRPAGGPRMAEAMRAENERRWA